jgi:hypothetical protein
MLTLFSGGKSRDCSGQTRREFLQVGAMGAGAMALPWLVGQDARGATSADFVRDKSVVLLYLNGGPSHIETWDPNMNLPAEIRSMTGEVKTSIPGVTFGGSFPKIAAQAHRLAVVRSFASGSGNHKAGTVRILTGGTRDSEKADKGYSMGAMYSRLRGGNDPVTGLPTFAQMIDEANEKAYQNGKNRFNDGNRPGVLGAPYSAFDPGGKGPLQENLALKMSAERFSQRRDLLASLDKLQRRVDDSASVSNYRRQAFDLILGSARKALDLSKEDPKTVKQYDTRHMRVGFKAPHPSPLGRHLLLARRLCEAGCGFVTINSPAWDMHDGANNPGITKGFNIWGPHLDHAVSAFNEDLHQRGLSDKIMLVITGEMGRTPRINKKGGRDHWGGLCSLLVAGGGLRMGQVIGQSDRSGGKPATEPYGPKNLMSTIMHTLFDVGVLRVTRGVPRELVSLVENEKPITELM